MPKKSGWHGFKVPLMGGHLTGIERLSGQKTALVVDVVFFRRDDFKPLVVAEDSENDVANLVHNSTERDQFQLGFAFLQIVVPKHRVVGGTFAGNANADKGDGENSASGDT